MSLRKIIPKRTCTNSFASYRSYKTPLRADFNQRCGYCDDLDISCGGTRGYHIDHFRPRKYFSHLECEYSNLVYSCPYCNCGKKADWPGEGLSDKGYIDPCLNEYDQHFERNSDGSIRALTAIGFYMFKHLNFGLKRHRLIYLKEELLSLLKAVNDSIQNDAIHTKNKDELKLRQTKLLSHYLKLEEEFRLSL